MKVSPCAGKPVEASMLVNVPRLVTAYYMKVSVTPTFRFMTADWDGQIRMDPSSACAMHRLIGMKDRFDLSFSCDTGHPVGHATMNDGRR